MSISSEEKGLPQIEYLLALNLEPLPKPKPQNQEEPLQITHLKYDGSYLGKHNFDDVVKWYWPCTKNIKGNKPIDFYASLNINGYPYPVILRRNCSRERDQIIVDELKQLFGINKIGCHWIRLRGIPKKAIKGDWILPNDQMNVRIYSEWAEYIVYRAITEVNEKDWVSFVELSKLSEINWLPTNMSYIQDSHREIFFNTQKILVFRQLLKVKDTNLDKILVQMTDSGTKIFSVDEMSMLNPNEDAKKNLKRIKLSANVESFFFPKTISRMEVLIKMLGLTNENYTAQIEIIRNSVFRIIHHIDDYYIWLVDQISTEIMDMVSVYYSLKK